MEIKTAIEILENLKAEQSNEEIKEALAYALDALALVKISLDGDNNENIP